MNKNFLPYRRTVSRRTQRQPKQRARGSDEAYVVANDVKVILVDDSAAVRDRLKSLLSTSTQVEVIGEAESPSGALCLVTRLHPEVVILDVVLEGGSGFEVLEKIEKLENPPTVIMFTNYSTPPFRRKAQEEGADFFFDKSTEFEKLIKVLQRKKITRRGSPHSQGPH